jgi:dephospho-CoA kinase
MIFADPIKRTTLEGILHPLIKARTMQRIMQSESEIVFYFVPLLVEANVDYPFDFVVTIEAGTNNQIKRLVESRGMSVEDATSRITAQATEAERVAKADLRIDGSVDLADLEVVVANLWKQVQLMATKKADHGKN